MDEERAGSEGFSAANAVPTILAILLALASSIWLVIIAWSRQSPGTLADIASGKS
jgi:hypothetical protein